MSFEKFAQSFTQGASAVAMDDAYPRNVCKCSIVKKFVDALGRFLDSRADQIDFLGCRAFPRTDRHASTCHRSRSGERRYSFNSDDLIDSDFHA